MCPLRWAAGALQGSLYIGHSFSLASEGGRKRRTTKNVMAVEKALRWLKKGLVHSVAHHLDTSQGLITLGLGI